LTCSAVATHAPDVWVSADIDTTGTGTPSAPDVWVSADMGSDTTGTGTPSAPFATLGKAQQVVQQLLAKSRMVANLTVHVQVPT